MGRTPRNDRFNSNVAYTQNTNGGIAWENMIALANQTGKDAWINVPHLANEDYIRNLANLWRDNLNPDQRLIVEYSNETWNVIFDQAQSSRWNYYESVGPRVLEVSQIFHEAFHDQAERLEIVLAGQSVNAYHVTEAIRYFQDQGFQANEVVDVIAIAPYIDADRNKEYVDLDTLFSEIDQQVTGMARHQSIAEFYGLKMYAYEAGQHLVPGRQILNWSKPPRTIPEWRPLITTLLRVVECWRRSGDGLFAGPSWKQLWFLGAARRYSRWG